MKIPRDKNSPPARGWSYSVTEDGFVSRYWHYYIDGVSLCKAWTITEDAIFERKSNVNDNCIECMKLFIKMVLYEKEERLKEKEEKKKS